MLQKHIIPYYFKNKLIFAAFLAASSDDVFNDWNDK